MGVAGGFAAGIIVALVLIGLGGWRFYRFLVSAGLNSSRRRWGER